MRILLAIALALMPTHVFAQTEPAQSEAIDRRAVLDRMCSPAGAMQFAFGETGVPGSSKIESMMQQGFGLPTAMAPFTDAQPRATEWSGKLMEMTYSAKMPKADADAETARIVAALEGTAWRRAALDVGASPLYLAGYGGENRFAQPVEGDTTVLLNIDYMFGALTLTCGRQDLLKAHAGEVFGQLPPGTPRPQVPEIAAPVVGDVAACSSPAIIAQMQEMMRTQKSATPFMGRMMERTTYRDRLTTWMTWKLEQSGKIGKEQVMQLILSSAGQGSPGGDPLAALKMLDGMFPILDAVGNAAKAEDPVAFCKGLVSMEQWLVKVDAITLKQTQSTQAALSAQAKRLGVSLD